MPKERMQIAVPSDWRQLQQLPEFQKFVAALSSAGIADLSVLEAGKTIPVERKPKLPSTDEIMFVLPEQAEKIRKGKKRKN